MVLGVQSWLESIWSAKSTSRLRRRRFEFPGFLKHAVASAEHSFGGFPAEACVGEGNSVTQFGQVFWDGLIVLRVELFPLRSFSFFS
jgi:hypothetical protein